MANKYCNLQGSKRISDDFANINIGFDRVEEDTKSLQQQANSAQQQITAHQTSTSAHPAQNITYAGGVAGQSNVKGAIDNLQQQVNTIVAVPNDGNAEVTQARQGLDGINYPTLKGRLDAMQQQQIQMATVSTPIKQGQNIIQADAPGPVTPTFVGRTLVDLLGIDGKDITKLATTGGTNTRTSTSDAALGTSAVDVSGASGVFVRTYLTTTKCEPGKYYLFVYWLKKTSGSGAVSVYIRKNDFSSGALFASRTNLTNTEWIPYWTKIVCPDDATSIIISFENTTQDTNYRLDAVSLFEVSTSDYAAIGTTLTDAQVAERWPYVDGIKHLDTPVLGKHGKNLLGPRPDNIHANAQVTEAYSLTLNATATNQNSTMEIDTLPNIQVTLQAAITGMGGQINLYWLNDAGAASYLGFLTGIGAKTFITPANCVRLRIQFFSTASGTFTFKNWQLELGGFATPFERRNDDYLYVPTTLASNIDGSVRDTAVVVGTEAHVIRRWRTGVVLDGALSWQYYNKTSESKTLYTPLSAGKSQPVTATKYDGSVMPSVIFTPDLFNNIYMHANGNTYVNVPNVDSGWDDNFTPNGTEQKAYFMGWKMNNGTFGTPYNGSGTKTWVPWNATNNTGAVTTVPTTPSTAITSGAFDYYRLTYQLAQSTTEIIPIEGALGNHSGSNLYELTEGVIPREGVVPIFSSGGGLQRYFINGSVTTPTPGEQRLAKRAAKILAVYKNDVIDHAWRIMSRSSASLDYGVDYAEINATDYDPNATYTVTYMPLDKYQLTSNIVDAKIEYAANPRGSIERLSQSMTDAETQISINTRAIAELYKQVRALGGE